VHVIGNTSSRGLRKKMIHWTFASIQIPGDQFCFGNETLQLRGIFWGNKSTFRKIALIFWKTFSPSCSSYACRWLINTAATQACEFSTRGHKLDIKFSK
jgi:hypothetical protein